MTDYVYCTRCPNFTEYAVPVPGVHAVPARWETVSISGRPIRNVVLCPDCVAAVRAVIEVLA